MNSIRGERNTRISRFKIRKFEYLGQFVSFLSIDKDDYLLSLCVCGRRGN